MADLGCAKEGRALLKFVEQNYPEERDTRAQRRVERKCHKRKSTMRWIGERCADAATLPVMLIAAAIALRLIFELMLVASS